MPMPARSSVLITVAVTLVVLVVRQGWAAEIRGGSAEGADLPDLPWLGRNGENSGKAPPSLAGQSAAYLIKALNDYRSGERKNDMMSLVAPMLKDKDVEDLAAYYSAIEVTVSPPPKNGHGRCRQLGVVRAGRHAGGGLVHCGTASSANRRRFRSRRQASSSATADSQC